MAHTHEEEWEYEYHENETEDFYIPLDLTNVPEAQVPMVSQGRPGHPILLKTRLRALNAARSQPREFSNNPTEGRETGNMGNVQIVGLHTTNPLVMYNGQLLSCHWGSTIGTDMFFVKPVSLEEGNTAPLRSLPSVDLLSLGSAKLVAKVGRLRPRDDLFDDNNNNSGPETEAITALNDESIVESIADQNASVERPSSESHVRPTPNSFLAKLNQAKAKRGDDTRLVISNTSTGTRLVAQQQHQGSIAEEGVQAENTH